MPTNTSKTVGTTSTEILPGVKDNQEFRTDIRITNAGSQDCYLAFGEDAKTNSGYLLKQGAVFETKSGPFSNCNVTAITGTSTTTLGIIHDGYPQDSTPPTMSSVAYVNATHLTVQLSETAKRSSIAKANDGGFTVAETGAPSTTYAVSAIAPGADDSKITLTVATMTASAAAGVTVTYTAGTNGTVQDLSGNLMATDSTGVATGPF